ncbi:MAG: RIP metalloprotease RseP [Candidatus Vogelbacteria bacterium CG10_big_fil_rev_8_21_14_0_10_51_16]|uniref:Zinc metalloprotease n=1 Tax=Candidatus Vogelbacteria bacterium CG10_big_fil_rev_8_21_14_0_10_51_16 TaxID=1975045 RepID=A0A2H0REG1_9BACT|nr:MAG: RIP metalloprotease RseP [Candidatus Vogelbacteria bacterium CG10_big_fil_rev_8_21_14_0_10_51_16]
MSIILFLIILIVLILVHEFGHFIVAKKSGIRVDEFGIGFPPRIKGWKKGETTYTLNWIPFGGFVKIAGEDVTDEELSVMSAKERDRNFALKPAAIKAAVIVAGVAFNFLLAWVLFSVGYMTGLPVPVDESGAEEGLRDVALVITGVQEGAAAEEAGLNPGDKILSLVADDGRGVPDLTTDAVREFIATRPGATLTLTYEREGETASATLSPRESAELERAVIGITMDRIGTLEASPLEAIGRGFIMTARVTGATVSGLYSLVKNALTGEGSFADVSGPVGIVRIVGDAARFGFAYLIGLTAVISVNLAVLNLLPFPALDGGRLLFLLIEKLKGSPIKPAIANTANMIGFYALIILMLVVTYHDVVKLFR